MNNFLMFPIALLATLLTIILGITAILVASSVLAIAISIRFTAYTCKGFVDYTSNSR